MQTLQDGYKGLTVLMSVHWDRLIYVFAIAVALYVGALLGMIAMEAMTHPVGY